MDNTFRTMPALISYDDYCQIPEDGNRYEVIDGVLYMSPSPIVRHQLISFNLSLVLGNWAKDTRACHVLYAPMDVVLSKHDVVQPDLIVVRSERASIIEKNNIQGAPDLLIEILSEGNRRHDEVKKRDLYEAHGVQEFWIIDPVLETIKVYRLEDGRFTKAVEWSLEAEDEVTSLLLPGFKCGLAEIFEG